MITHETSLDVDSPDKVADILEYVASTYIDSGVELSAAWGDKNAGKVWFKLAEVLEQAAHKCRIIVHDSL